MHSCGGGSAAKCEALKAHDLLQWEQLTGKRWHDLGPADRTAANVAITELQAAMERRMEV
jgi:hypothetical protein